jgi:hypothetical protein
VIPYQEIRFVGTVLEIGPDFFCHSR